MFLVFLYPVARCIHAFSCCLDCHGDVSSCSTIPFTIHHSPFTIHQCAFATKRRLNVIYMQRRCKRGFRDVGFDGRIA